MKIFFCLFALAFASSSFAQQSSMQNTSQQSFELQDELRAPTWTVTGELSTISISPHATFGPAMFYSSSESNMWGVRVLAPLSRSERITVNTIQFAWRHNFQYGQTSIFLEPTFSQNYIYDDIVIRDYMGASFGANFGVSHYFDSQFGIGGYGGIDVSQTYVSRNDFGMRSGMSAIYPRITVFGTIAF